MNDRDNYRIIIPILAVLVLIAVGISVYFIMHEDDSPKKPDVQTVTEDASKKDSSDEQGATSSFDAIVTGVDLDGLALSVVRLGSSEFEEYYYNGATSIITKYDRQITAALLKPGDFVSITFTDENLLTKVCALKDIDVYEKILNPVIEENPKRITIAGETYQYDDNLLILNDGYFVGLNTLVSTDILTAYSRDGFIYMLKVFSGHGYLALSHTTAFLGGTLSIAHEGDFEITEDFMYTLPEGEYSIRATNGEDSGSETVLISRDRTSILDLDAFLPNGGNYSVITFSIEPKEATLYIDGIMKNHNIPVAVGYGEHRIDVIADGYTSYEGPITVSRETGALSISLPIAAVKQPSMDEEPDYDYELPSDQTSNDKTGSGSTSDSTKQNSSSTQGSDTGVTSYPGIPDSTSDTDGDSFGSETPEIEDLTLGDEDSDAPGLDGEDSDKTDTDKTDTDKTDSGKTDKTASDKLQMIIECSDGAAVYINDVYKGVISGSKLAFQKPAEGTVSVRITKEGYVTKYYTVSIDDDGEDASFKFPAMVPLG